MRIGLVLPGFSANERDWCIPALYDFVRTLAYRNDVSVFALEYPYRRDHYQFFGAMVFALDGRHRGKLFAPRLWQRALSAIFAEHRRERFDILHAFWVNEPGLIAITAARALRIPVIASVAGGELVGFRSIDYGGQLSRLEKMIVKMVMKGADQITVGSRYLQQIAGRWRRDAQFAPLGIDTGMFSPNATPATRRTRFGAAPISPAPTRIINVGSLSTVKQHEILLEAFSRVKSNSELEIVGAGERLAILQTRAVELGIGERVRFTGAVEHHLLPQEIRWADIFVQSSCHEAQAMAVLEAAACGVTTAGTPVGIVPELAESEAAVSAADFEAESLKNAIGHALESRYELGCNARKVVEKDFSLESTRTRWMDLYTRLM